MAVVTPLNPSVKSRAFMTNRKRDKQTDHLPLAWPANVNVRPSPMPCAKEDARPREDPTDGGGRVDPIAARLQRIPSSPDTGDESGLEANDAGSMVARRRQEGGRRKAEAEDKEVD